MKIFKLVFKNAFRHKLRSFLTILGIAIAVIAFGVLRTVVTAWYVGVEATAANRLVTRQAVSFIFPLPYTYRDKIQQVPGVSQVTFATWFQGVYIDKNQFFARFACDAETMFDVNDIRSRSRSSIIMPVSCYQRVIPIEERALRTP